MSVPVAWAKTRYAETFSINGRAYGIEDYEQPGDHFFPDLPHKRFKLWVGGASIGEHNLLGEARKALHGYAVSLVTAEYHGHQERMVRAQRVLQRLGDDQYNLSEFQV